MAALHSALADADLVILDFDGPLVRLLPDPEHIELAASAVAYLRAAGADVPPSIATLQDHGAVLLEAGRRWPHLAETLAVMCTAAEVDGARRQPPQPGALELLAALAAHGVPVSIVTNNDPACVTEFTRRWGVSHRVRTVHGRDPARPDRLKPNPAMLLEALASAGVAAGRAVMVGDSVSDIEAACAAGVAAVGITTDAERAARMKDIGAVAVVPDTAALIRRTP